MDLKNCINFANYWYCTIVHLRLLWHSCNLPCYYNALQGSKKSNVHTSVPHLQMYFRHLCNNWSPVPCMYWYTIIAAIPIIFFASHTAEKNNLQEGK